MKQFELPVVYCLNFKEVNTAIEQGLPEPERDEYVKMTFFLLPDEMFIRVNENNNPKRTTLWFDESESYVIDAEYELVLETIKRAYRKPEGDSK